MITFGQTISDDNKQRIALKTKVPFPSNQPAPFLMVVSQTRPRMRPDWYKTKTKLRQNRDGQDIDRMKTGWRQDGDKTEARLRQDLDKTKTRLTQDLDKTETRLRQD